MAKTGHGSAAAAKPGGGGSNGGGSGGGNGGKRPAPSASPEASPTKRGKAGVKDEASKPKEEPAAAAAAAAAVASASGKPVPQKLPQPRRPWARMLAQWPETPHVRIFGDKLSIGRGDNCHICLDDQAVSKNLCMLRHLQQGGPCKLEVTGLKGKVVVNGISIISGAKVPLRGGDEVIFGQSAKHAYIFQHPLRDTEVNKAVLISADESADIGPTGLASGCNNLEGQLAVRTTSAPENQSNFRCPNPAVTLPPSRWQTFKNGLKHGILNPKDITVTLDNFPYYLSETTKEILLSCASIHFEKMFRKSLQKISSLNQRILLSGPSGSEIYQETLIKALAKHFDARLLILDSLTLGVETSSKDARVDAPCSSRDIEGTSNINTFREGDRVEYIGNVLLKLVRR